MTCLCWGLPTFAFSSFMVAFGRGWSASNTFHGGGYRPSLDPAPSISTEKYKSGLGFSALSFTQSSILIMAPTNLDDALKLIQSLPKEEWKLIPVAPPPKGVIPNFTNPSSLAPAIIGVGGAFLVLAFICFSIRIYMNLIVARKWSWSDGMFTSALFSHLPNGPSKLIHDLQ